MDDPLSRGLPFELADIWRRSAFQLQDADQSLFATLQHSCPALELPSKPSGLGYELSIPPLEGVGIDSGSQHLEPVDSDIASPPSERGNTGQDGYNDPASVWDLDLRLDLLPERPRLHTWEAFETQSVPHAERTAYLSEAGPGAFDAVLAKRDGKSSGVLPQDVMLRALCNLTLGRASVFFQWNEQKGTFIRTLDHVPISGFSSTASDSCVQQLVRYATLCRSLRSSCLRLHSMRQALSCKISFNGCLSSILDAIEEHITKQLPRVRSVLQLQALVEPSHDLLATLDKISLAVKAAQSDEGVISALSDHVQEILSADSSLGGVLRVMLERTSTPWLEKLAMEFGLIEDPANIVGAELEEDMTGNEFDAFAMAAPASKGDMPGFMSIEDRATIYNAKASLRLLRKSQQQSAINKTAQEMCQSALGRTPVSAADASAARASAGAVEDDHSVAMLEDFLWGDSAVQHSVLARIDAQMSRQPQHATNQDDRLRDAVLSYCETSEPGLNLGKSLVSDISPMDRLRPALTLQSRHLNRTLLQHFFANESFHHLRLQHSYHFLSSGEFVTRLSTALFSAETQSAERKRGTIPTGQTMGLRLGARNKQRWPPASSELRLTLMDVLTEAHQADYPTFSHKLRSKELPGGLSFSIRELPEHEIERVMDPSSIYALDFLRLQYTAPTPLDAILASSTLQVYDSIFRQLMRVLRVINVTTALTRELSNQAQQIRGDDDGASASAQQRRRKFAHQAHSFITVLLSHMEELGISAPWRSFTRGLEAVERSLRDESAVPIGIEALKQMHTAMLETIRGRLFLRRKQEKLRAAVEDVLSRVLKGAAAVEGEDQRGKLEEAIAGFQGAVKGLLKLLKSAVDKPTKTRNATNMSMNGMIDANDEDETEMMKMLLVRLDWNGFYRESETALV